MKKIYISAALCFALSSSIKAQSYQPGYAILNNGKRISGMIKLYKSSPWNNQRYIWFKDSAAYAANPHVRAKKYAASELKFYQVGSLRFDKIHYLDQANIRLRNLYTTSEMMEEVSRGRIKAYMFYSYPPEFFDAFSTDDENSGGVGERNGSMIKYRILFKKDGAKHFHNAYGYGLASYFKDTPEILEKYKKGAYGNIADDADASWISILTKRTIFTSQEETKGIIAAFNDYNIKNGGSALPGVDSMGIFKPYVFSGTVTNGLTHIPLPGVTVSLIDSLTNQSLQQTLTDSTGTYKFTLTNKNPFRIKIDKSGYVSQNLAVPTDAKMTGGALFNPDIHMQAIAAIDATAANGVNAGGANSSSSATGANLAGTNGSSAANGANAGGANGSTSANGANAGGANGSSSVNYTSAIGANNSSSANGSNAGGANGSSSANGANAGGASGLASANGTNTGGGNGSSSANGINVAGATGSSSANGVNAGGANGSASTSNLSADGTGSVKPFVFSGLIKNGNTQIPLTGVTVSLVDLQTQQVVQQSVTDSRGVYKFILANKDSFSIKVEKPEYLTKNVPVPAYAKVTGGKLFSPVIHLRKGDNSSSSNGMNAGGANGSSAVNGLSASGTTASASASDLNANGVSSISPYLFSGIIKKGTTHTPLAGVTVSLVDLQTQQVVQQTVTDSRGVYKFTLTNKNAFSIKVEKQGYLTKNVPVPAYDKVTGGKLFSPLINLRKGEANSYASTNGANASGANGSSAANATDANRSSSANGLNTNGTTASASASGLNADGSIKPYVFSGIINKGHTHIPLTGVTVSLIDVQTQQVVQQTITDSRGVYKFILTNKNAFSIRVEKQGYLTKNVSVPAYAKVTGGKLFNPVIHLRKGEDNANDLNASNANGTASSNGINTSAANQSDATNNSKGYELNKGVVSNILYDFGKSTLRAESTEVLDKLVEMMNANPKIKVELGSHTDAIGSKSFNLKLSQRRAQACVDYMISKGIDKDRITAKGYGKSKPIAPNFLANGKDNPAGRQLNRRTEFTVLNAE